MRESALIDSGLRQPGHHLNPIEADETESTTTLKSNSSPDGKGSSIAQFRQCHRRPTNLSQRSQAVQVSFECLCTGRSVMKFASFSPRTLARRSARHPWITIGVWLVFVVAVIMIGTMTPAKELTNDFTSNPDSKVGTELLDEHFGNSSAASETIVIRSETYTVDSPEFRSVVDTTLASLVDWQGDMASVVNYYNAPEASESAQLVSVDRHSLMIPVTFKENGANMSHVPSPGRTRSPRIAPPMFRFMRSATSAASKLAA